MTRLKRIRIHAQRLRYADARRSDDRAILLMVGGIGATVDAVSPLAEALSSQRIGLVSMDLPGVGGSPAPKRLMRLPQHARLLEALLDTLGIEKVHVMGHSWGGTLAQQLARQAPQCVDRLVLACTSAGSFMVPGTPRALMSFANPKLYAPEILVGSRSVLFRKHAARRPPRLDLAGFAWQSLAAVGWTSIHWLHRLAMPTLVLAGERDELVPLINARVLARRIPNARLRVMAGCGHLFPYTRAEETAAVLSDFLLTT